MSPNIEFEARLLVMSMATGAGLMALYDLLRAYRALVRHGWLWVGMEDLAYWIFAGFMVFYLLYRENDGALRLYAIGAVLLTMVAYDRLIGTFLRKVLKKAKRCFKIGIWEKNRRKREKKGRSW